MCYIRCSFFYKPFASGGQVCCRSGLVTQGCLPPPCPRTCCWIKRGWDKRPPVAIGVEKNIGIPGLSIGGPTHVPGLNKHGFNKCNYKNMKFAFQLQPKKKKQMYSHFEVKLPETPGRFICNFDHLKPLIPWMAEQPHVTSALSQGLDRRKDRCSLVLFRNLTLGPSPKCK